MRGYGSYLRSGVRPEIRCKGLEKCKSVVRSLVINEYLCCGVHIPQMCNMQTTVLIFMKYLFLDSETAETDNF